MQKQSQPTRTRLVTLVLVGSAFLAGVDLFIVNVAFDDIAQDLAAADGRASLANLSWILTAYAVVFAALLVPLGRLCDRYGRKRGFVTGLVVFTAASAACGFAGGVWELVAFRAVQAVGAAAMTPASLGLLLAALPDERKAAGARLWTLVGALAAALGPAVGGVLVQISWHWAFWINVPIGIALVIGAWRVVPDVRHDSAAPRPDLLGAAILTVGIAALMLGIVEGNEWGWTSAPVLASFAVSALALAWFARRCVRHPAPVVDAELMRFPSFAWATSTTLIFNTAFGASLLGGILWLQVEWGYTALQTGLAIAVGPLLVPITSIVVHRVLPDVRPGAFIAAGCLVFAAGACLTAVLLSASPAYVTTFLPGWLLAGVGVGLAMPNMVAAATAPLPVERVSTGGGVVNMARQVGIALGVSWLIAVVGTEVPTIAAFRTAWFVVAGVMLLAGSAAVAMEVSRERRSAVPPTAPAGRVASRS